MDNPFEDKRDAAIKAMERAQHQSEVASRDATISRLTSALAAAAAALERAEETIREFVSDIEDGGSIRFAKTYVDRHRSARDCARSALAAIKAAMEGKP